MLNKNNVTLRNLQEQVLDNKQRIENHYAIDRALANFGIKIVGTVASINDLPDPLTYGGEFGDGYAVGTPGAYTYYIYTRPDFNAGQFDNYWLDVGSISIVGPAGPQGIQGPEGPEGKSTKWYTGESYPENPEQGDMFLNTNGNVYQYIGAAWVLIANIKGPQGVQGIQGPQGLQGEQGEQGPAGPQGDVGGFINIAGIIANTEQLPTPESLNNLTVAYLVGAKPYNLYVQVGETPATAMWENMGELNVATYVTVGGVFQNVWDADTKVDKAGSSNFRRIYACDAAGNTSMLIQAINRSLSIGGRIPQYHSSTADASTPPAGYLMCNTPAQAGHAANKQYVDDTLTNYVKTPAVSSNKTVLSFGINSNNPVKLQYTMTPVNGAIPQYDTAGHLKTNEPAADLDCANKAYVDSKISTGGGAYQHYIRAYGDLNGVGVDFSFNIVNSISTTMTSSQILDYLYSLKTGTRLVVCGYTADEYGVPQSPIIQCEKQSGYDFIMTEAGVDTLAGDTYTLSVLTFVDIF